MSMADQILPVLDRFLSSRLEAIHTCVPASVESYDPSTRKATIRPVIRLRMEAGPVIEMLPVSGVPVIFPTSAAFTLTYPLAKGDSGLLLFSEASMGNWLKLQTPGVADPEDCSRFSLTDAIFLPGLYPFLAVPSPANSLEIKEDGTITLTSSGGASVGLDPSGLIALSNQVSGLKALVDSLWDQMKSLSSELSTQFGLIATAGAPAPLTPIGTACGTASTAIGLLNTAEANAAFLVKQVLK